MKKNAIWFLSVVLFFGILLTMALYVGLDLFLVGEGDGFGSDFRFNRVFYEDHALRSFTRYVDYKVFHHMEGDGVVHGREDWLYETVDPDSGFPYLLDYVSGVPFTEEETMAIGDILADRAAFYEQRGVRYFLVVIPSAYTACGEYLPAYLGDPSPETRLRCLSSALDERGISCFLDLSEKMKAADGQGARYHNTENAINAYGGFTVYDSVMTALAELGMGEDACRLSFSDMEFTTHYTEGRAIARRVGLAHLIPNRTVSLTNRFSEGYFMTDTTEHCVSSRMNEGVKGNEATVVIECSEEWDKIQLTPYFSSTFETVVYESRITDGKEAVAYHGADVLIQILHEDELGLLLP